MREQRKPNWFTAQSAGVRIGLGTLALILVCLCCALGIAATSNNSNTPTTSAASTSTDRPEVTNTPAKPTATSKPKAWRTVQHFTGNGSTQSDVFPIRNGDHVIASCTGDAPDLAIMDLYRQGESAGNNDSYLTLMDFANEPCMRNTFTIQQGDADVYLRVNSDGVSWTVDVQRYQ